MFRTFLLAAVLATTACSSGGDSVTLLQLEDGRLAYNDGAQWHYALSPMDVTVPQHIESGAGLGIGGRYALLAFVDGPAPTSKQISDAKEVKVPTLENTPEDLGVDEFGLGSSN